MNFKYLFALVLVSLSSVQYAAADYSAHPDAVKLINELADEGLDPEKVKTVLAAAERKQSIIDAISRPAEKTLTWGRYRNIFLKDQRISEGADFWARNEQVLKEAESTFGVPAEIVVAIIGVETYYGKYKGKYRVADALATLAFDYPKRSAFFRSELKHFFRLVNEQGQDPLQFKGSYAGAMGLGQFIPSSYRAYAKGYADDGFVDIWSDENDAIWSVANYLLENGWKPGLPIAQPVKAGDPTGRGLVSNQLKPDLSVGQLIDAGFVFAKPEHLEIVPQSGEVATLMNLETEEGFEEWVGWQNFYAITRYNHSKLYAMAVFQLAESIRQAR